MTRREARENAVELLFEYGFRTDADAAAIYGECFKLSYALRQSIAPVFGTNDFGSADILPNDGRMIAVTVIML